MIRKFTEYEKLRKEYYDTNKKPNEVKKVVKPWGYELWMADKSNSKFALKKFLLRRHINQVFNFTKPKRKVYLLLVEKVDYITLMIKSILKI